MSFTIDAKFPGGNIVVEKIDGDTVHLSPDLTGTLQPWFYWYFRVTGAGGRTLTFSFDTNYVGARGPGVSVDEGQTWNWLGVKSVQDGAFDYTFPAGPNDVRFSVGMPYVRANFDRFLARYKDNPDLQADTLATTPQGRDVMVVRVGDKQARYAVAITARHHCCEMLASYVLEGILTGAVADEWLRRNVEFLFVPFMDTDGVEDGQQGKNRAPHDHNRDYIETPLYREVAAFRERLPAWAAGRPLIFLDLHDPVLKSDIHEVIHFLEPEARDQAARLDRLANVLERNQRGLISYSQQHTLRFGTGYNGPTKGLSSGWVRSLPNTILGVTLEIPYANASGCEVNAHSAREFGRDIAVAFKHFLNEDMESAVQIYI